LGIDTLGNALLAYRDDSGVDVQIAAARVAPDGTLQWGPGGILLTATDFVAAPKIVGTTDGQIVVAWTQNASVVEPPAWLQPPAPRGSRCSSGRMARTAPICWRKPSVPRSSPIPKVRPLLLRRQPFRPEVLFGIDPVSWGGICGPFRAVWDGGLVSQGFALGSRI
jgi:hypothetical protein